MEFTRDRRILLTSAASSRSGGTLSAARPCASQCEPMEPRDASEPAANLFSFACGHLAARQTVTGSGGIHGAVSPEAHDAAKTAQSIYVHRERNGDYSRFERERTE